MEKLPSCANNCKSKVKDDYYMDRMKEILTGFPNTGPPNYPVKLTEHVYIGSQKHADDVEMLKRYGITHVLNCAGLRRYDFSRSPYPKESGIKGFLMISAIDHEDFDIACHFDEAIAFLDKVKKNNGRALVHCNLGVNRSGAIVAAYLMAEQNRTLLEVINYLKLKRFVILCNRGFRRQLIAFARSRGLLDPVIRYSDGLCPDHEPELSAYHQANNSTDADKKPPPQQQENGWTFSFKFGGSKKSPSLLAAAAAAGSAAQQPDVCRHEIDNPSKTGVEEVNSKKPSSPIDGQESSSLLGRFLTLPRSSPSSDAKDLPAKDQPAIEVIVSDHTDTDPGANDPKSRTKTFQQQLLPVYEASSSDASSSSGIVGRPRTDSVSSKFGGFLTLLGPKKKPLRSTSFSNVSTSQGLNPTGGNDEPSTSLSTSRPLRIYTRSSTDSELYRPARTHPSTSSLTATSAREFRQPNQP